VPDGHVPVFRETITQLLRTVDRRRRRGTAENNGRRAVEALSARSTSLAGVIVAGAVPRANARDRGAACRLRWAMSLPAGGILMNHEFERVMVGMVVMAGALASGGCAAETGTDTDQQTGVEQSDLQAAIHHRIQNAYYQQCVSPRFAQLNEILTMETCSTKYARQYWNLIPATTSSWYIVNDATNYCAEVNNGTSNPGERVDEWYCDGETSEQWVEVPVALPNGKAAVLLQHAGTNLCLDTVGGTNSQLMQWPCDPGNQTQAWFIL
jgi:hypothetical protein